MASAPSALRTVPAPVARPWSADASARWAVRVGIFVPLVAIATVVLGRTGASVTDRLLLARADLARSGSFEGLRWAYPPIPTFIASIVRTPTLLVASGCAFVALAGLVVAERLTARGLPMWLKVLLVVGIMATPSAWFVITQDVAAVMGLCLLVVAIDGFERFAMDGHTIGGFVTGLALGAAVLCDPAAVLYALALSAAAPLIAIARYRGSPGVTQATLLVFAFPTVAALGAWWFVEWRFTGSAFHTVRNDLDLFAFRGGLGETIVRELRRLVGVIGRSPLFVAVAIVMALRRPISMLGGYLLPLLALLLGWTIGLVYPDVLAVVLLATLAAMTIPERIGRGDHLLIAAGVGAQLVVAWTWLPTAFVVQPWLDRLFG